ncbi:type IV pilus modification PilV family protein [Rummeliibacillus sp. JY-2-4R]
MSLHTILKKTMQNEKGVTLVEVVASFVILVILLVSFYTLFIQTKQTTKSSAEIVNATYIAQTEMENAYQISLRRKNNAFSNQDSFINSLSNSYPEEINASMLKEYRKTKDQFIIEMKLENRTEQPYLMNIVIEVKSNNGKDKAKMENVLVWKDI